MTATSPLHLMTLFAERAAAGDVEAAMPCLIHAACAAMCSPAATLWSVNRSTTMNIRSLSI
jgi:hypothetical protein